ncbi:MAG TPA: hypothetical protein VHL79_20600 [Ramlibacter sp.]|jgi:hypothetical protein|nr:hypothetical protein [Ramlibacter sp.]
MRFSSIFQLPITPREAAGEAAPRRDAPAEAAPAPLEQDLPDDLDARVRLVGEWQLGED